MKLNFMTYSGKSVLNVDQDLTALIKKDAVKAGWPADIAKRLKITIKDLKINVHYPIKYADIVEDLEYGTQSTPPQSVFRRFLTKHNNFIFNKLTSQSVDYLFESGVLP